MFPTWISTPPPLPSTVSSRMIGCRSRRTSTDPQRANLTEAIKPGMIHVEHDWWFPEREATDDLHGAFDSNCNVLFENNGPYDPAVGTDNFGGLCKVYKADDGAPKNICMNSEDLKIFLPLSADQLAADDQQDGVTQVTKGGAK